MNTLEKYIDFSKISSHEFEELCFELLLKHGFHKLLWRKGGADNGRDIEGEITINNSLIGQYNDKYFFECKKYEKGVPPEILNSKLAWADVEKPQHLVFIITSYVSNNGRTWLEKLEKSKDYKIHLIEGDLLKKIISQHEDLVTKYFISDKLINLLNDTINKWIIHNLTPNFYTFYYLIHEIDLSQLSINQQAFLYTLYFTNYSRLEELENEIYHGIDIDSELNELAENLKNNSNHSIPVLKNEFDVDSLSDEGYLNFEEEKSNSYDFIASHVVLISSNSLNKKGKHKFTYYVFKRLSQNEAIEILLYHSSNLEYKIRYIDNYNFENYKESVNNLGIKPKFTKKIIDLSLNMK